MTNTENWEQEIRYFLVGMNKDLDLESFIHQLLQKERAKERERIVEDLEKAFEEWKKPFWKGGTRVSPIARIVELIEKYEGGKENKETNQ